VFSRAVRSEIPYHLAPPPADAKFLHPPPLHFSSSRSGLHSDSVCNRKLGLRRLYHDEIRKSGTQLVVIPSIETNLELH